MSSKHTYRQVQKFEPNEMEVERVANNIAAHALRDAEQKLIRYFLGLLSVHWQQRRSGVVFPVPPQQPVQSALWWTYQRPQPFIYELLGKTLAACTSEDDNGDREAKVATCKHKLQEQTTTFRKLDLLMKIATRRFVGFDEC